MIEFAALLGVVGLLIAAYLVSLYSLAVYIDPDEVENLFPNVSRSRRDFLKKLADDPRAFVQTAIIYKALALVVITALLLRTVDSWFVDSSWLYWIGKLALLAIVWVAYIVIVEYLPRKQSRTAINLHMARRLWLVSLVYVIMLPAVSLYRMGLARLGDAPVVSEEDKEEIVERAIETLAEQAGIAESIVEDDEKEMIGQIFQLDQTVVREIMIPRPDVIGIEKTMSFTEIRDTVIKTGHSRYPVFDGTIDRILGMIYVKDLFNKMPPPGEKFVIKNYLRSPYFVPESKVIGQLLREFKLKRLHIAMVLDEYGGVAGLVSLEDIIEEIFGEIHDEHDQEEGEFIALSRGVYRVSANLMVEKLQYSLDTDYDHANYDTVGGLIYDLVGSVPKQGQVIHWHDLQFEIERVEGQRIITVKVTAGSSQLP